MHSDVEKLIADVLLLSKVQRYIPTFCKPVLHKVTNIMKSKGANPEIFGPHSVNFLYPHTAAVLWKSWDALRGPLWDRKLDKNR